LASLSAQGAARLRKAASRPDATHDLLSRREDENPAVEAKTTRSPHAVALFLLGRRLALVENPHLDVK
jgi:hypothetical protein